MKHATCKSPPRQVAGAVTRLTVYRAASHLGGKPATSGVKARDISPHDERHRNCVRNVRVLDKVNYHK